MTQTNKKTQKHKIKQRDRTQQKQSKTKIFLLLSKKPEDGNASL